MIGWKVYDIDEGSKIYGSCKTIIDKGFMIFFKDYYIDKVFLVFG